MSDYFDLPLGPPRPRSDPSYLAYELFDQIIGFATDGSYDVKALRSFSRVSKQWGAAVQPRMYAKWEYDGQYHSITSLWQFLRTIIDHRELADSLRIIHIRTWTLGLVRVRGGRSLTFSDHDLGKLKDAIHTVGLQCLESRFMEALRRTDPRPLMALVLAHARNLQILYAELPETDIFFAEMLRKATEDQHSGPKNGYAPLHNLREAYLASSWNYGTRNTYELKLSNLSPIFHLPSIQKLSVFDFEANGASNIFESCPKSSSITDLTLHFHSHLTAPDAKALFALPKTLTKLSIYMDNVTFSRGENIYVSHEDLWDIIRQYAHCIETLDIHRGRLWFDRSKHGGHRSLFGSMKEFKLLHSLYIQPHVLVGGLRGDPNRPLKLVDTLPPNLRTLTAYGDEELVYDNAIGHQFRDVVTSLDFPHLEHVILEKNFDGKLGFIYPKLNAGFAAETLHGYVERVCQENGIKFEAKHGSSLPKGGNEHSYYQDIVQKRRKMAKTMKEIQEALTDYLKRLKGMKVVWSGTHSFTIDDLDEFELPWKELLRMRIRMHT